MIPQFSSFLRQGDDFRVLLSQIRSRKIVHAYLLTGEKGLGKRTMAKMIGASLLCSAENDRPCGKCKNCMAALSGEHPDLIIIGKGMPLAPNIKKDRATIPVDDIREIKRICSVHSTEGNMRIVLIFDADKMTPQAQNCLLKTLEEPPEDTCLILVTEHTDSLLPTVISRCRIIRFKPWNDEYVHSVLKERNIPDARARDAVLVSGGSIGKAVELATDETYWQLREDILASFFRNVKRSEMIKISNQWKDRKGEAEQILQILEFLVRSLLDMRFCYGKIPDPEMFPAQWQRFSREAGEERFVLLLDAIRDARKQLQFSTNFQAVTERLLLVFMGEGNTWLQ